MTAIGLACYQHTDMGHFAAVFHIGDVIKKLREGREWTIEDLVRESGVSKMTISNIERGARDPRKSSVDRLAVAFGFSDASGFYALLRSGELPGQPAAPTPQIQTVELRTAEGPEDFVVVPLLADRIAAGRPLVVREEDIASHVAFPPALIEQLGVTKPYCVRVGRNERSMFPTIPPDAVVLLDCADAKRENPKNGRIYAVNVEEGSTLKRVVIAGGVLTLHSDNLDKGEYPSRTVEAEDGVELSSIIVGEAVWCGTSLL